MLSSGLGNYLGAHGERLVPRRFVTKIAGNMFKPEKKMIRRCESGGSPPLSSVIDETASRPLSLYISPNALPDTRALSVRLTHCENEDFQACYPGSPFEWELFHLPSGKC